MALILNIETSTEICSVGLALDGKTIGLQESSERFEHAKMITILIEKLMSDANCSLSDLDALSVDLGPGSYTALRVGLSVAKGICYSLDKPLLGQNSLKPLAFASKTGKNTLLVPMIDARRMEVYTAFYDDNLNEIEEIHALILEENSFDKYLDKYDKVIISGSGAEKCKQLFTSDKFVITDIVSSAKNMSELSEIEFLSGNFIDYKSIAPEYFKAPNITKSKKNILG